MNHSIHHASTTTVQSPPLHQSIWVFCSGGTFLALQWLMQTSPSVVCHNHALDWSQNINSEYFK